LDAAGAALAGFEDQWAFQKIKTWQNRAPQFLSLIVDVLPFKVFSCARRGMLV